MTSSQKFVCKPNCPCTFCFHTRNGFPIPTSPFCLCELCMGSIIFDIESTAYQMNAKNEDSDFHIVYSFFKDLFQYVFVLVFFLLSTFLVLVDQNQSTLKKVIQKNIINGLTDTVEHSHLLCFFPVVLFLAYSFSSPKKTNKCGLLECLSKINLFNYISLGNIKQTTINFLSKFRPSILGLFQCVFILAFFLLSTVFVIIDQNIYTPHRIIEKDIVDILTNNVEHYHILCFFPIELFLVFLLCTSKKTKKTIKCGLLKCLSKINPFNYISLVNIKQTTINFLYKFRPSNALFQYFTISIVLYTMFLFFVVSVGPIISFLKNEPRRINITIEPKNELDVIYIMLHYIVGQAIVILVIIPNIIFKLLGYLFPTYFDISAQTLFLNGLSILLSIIEV